MSERLKMLRMDETRRRLLERERKIAAEAASEIEKQIEKTHPQIDISKELISDIIEKEVLEEIGDIVKDSVDMSIQTIEEKGIKNKVIRKKRLVIKFDSDLLK